MPESNPHTQILILDKCGLRQPVATTICRAAEFKQASNELPSKYFSFSIRYSWIPHPDILPCGAAVRARIFLRRWVTNASISRFYRHGRLIGDDVTQRRTFFSICFIHTSSFQNWMLYIIGIAVPVLVVSRNQFVISIHQRSNHEQLQSIVHCETLSTVGRIMLHLRWWLKTWIPLDKAVHDFLYLLYGPMADMYKRPSTTADSYSRLADRQYHTS